MCIQTALIASRDAELWHGPRLLPEPAAELVRQIIECTVAESKEKIKVVFIGGTVAASCCEATLH